MKKLATAALATAMAISMGVAIAGERAQGKIQAVDPVTKQIRLEDGTMLQLSESAQIRDLKPGQEVMVSYETKDGKNTVTRIEVKK